MEETKLPGFINDLMVPAIFDHPVDDVKLVQTHISYVILAGNYVYKIKKPVDFGFLDFSTREKRAHYCEQELVLNRRLCPEIYLGLVNITREGSGHCLDGKGEVVECGVKMARMPEEKMMSRVIGQGLLTKGHLDGIIDALVPFYRDAAGGETLASFGKAESVSVNVLENFDQTESFIGQGALDRGQFDRIGSYSRAMLAREDLFAQRVATGKICDCHGDLYSANICLDEKIHIFDCIEFNERFRYSDVAADVGFLAMDLDYHGLEEMSRYFIDRYIEVSGDETLGDMVVFYKCYRAYVRGKINLFTAADPAVDKETAASCTEQAKRYFTLADRYAGA